MILSLGTRQIGLFQIAIIMNFSCCWLKKESREEWQEWNPCLSSRAIYPKFHVYLLVICAVDIMVINYHPLDLIFLPNLAFMSLRSVFWNNLYVCALCVFLSLFIAPFLDVYLVCMKTHSSASTCWFKLWFCKFTLLCCNVIFCSF